MISRLNRNVRKTLQAGRLPGSGREGFTLVEIMMVLMILTVGVLPIAIIQHQAREEVSEADRYSQAVEVAQLHLERIKGMGFGNGVVETGTAGQVTWASQINQVSFGLERITVTATWNNDGSQETVTLTDLVSMR
jgi:prepilin-type N-terminal cleavage/methylation domain-containing protein